MEIPTPSFPPHPRLDQGLLLIVAGLFFASILAHRYWRAKIRLEDELQAQKRDADFTQSRYREAWCRSTAEAAFVDRNNGLVIEVTGGWTAAGLPAAGTRIHAGDGALEAAWSRLPGPDAEGRAAEPVAVSVRGRTFTASPLAGGSLGIVLLTLDAGGGRVPSDGSRP